MLYCAQQLQLQLQVVAMNTKKELCRNFQRGSCQFGERCRYLHVTERQNNPNPYGFGAKSGNQNQLQQQQQKPNPFGFGVQIGSQTKGASGLGTSQQNQAKPFANIWNRLNSATTATSFPSSQSEAQKQQNIHICSNPEECKQIFIEDSKNESPLWKLSCYGHWRGLPCDINGDISYEELRAAAYEDARQGLSLQSIVEKERNLLNSKLAEYNNLLQRPYVITSNAVEKNSFHKSDFTEPISLNKNTGPLSVSSFSQAGAFLNGSSNNSAPFTSTHNQPSPFATATSKVGPFGANNSQFKGSGFLNVQSPPRPFGTFDRSNIQTSESVSKGNGFFFSPPVTAQNPTSSVNNQLAQTIEMSKPISNALPDFLVNQPIHEQIEGTTDSSIWLKAEWKRGEIPEEPPSDKFT